jgi:hypothetical protein
VGLSNGGFAELIDERSGTVAPAGWPVRPRIRHAAVALADGRVLVVGGLQSNSVELWEPQAQRFRLVAARMANAREYPSATLLADGRVLIVGGDHVGPTQQLAEIFDPATETFAAVASPLNAERRAMHAAHRLPDGRVLVLGGEVRSADDLAPLDSVLVFDPAAQALALHGRLDGARSLVRSALLADGQVRLFGGITPGEAAAATASAYGPGSVARALAAMPAGRAGRRRRRGRAGIERAAVRLRGAAAPAQRPCGQVDLAVGPLAALPRAVHSLKAAGVISRFSKATRAPWPMPCCSSTLL